MATTARASITLRVKHTTRYAYSEPVSLSMHQVRLTPRTLPDQQVTGARLQIEPPASTSSTRTDYFGNEVTTFSIGDAHQELRVTSESLVTRRGGAVTPPPSPALADAVTRLRARETDADLEAVEFLVESRLVPRGRPYARYAAETLVADRPLFEGVAALMTAIHRDFTYDPASTTVSTPVSTVLEQRRGVCQDFAHLMIACLRSHHVAARYVSGYLVPRAGVVGAQASHAWVSVYCPGVGWVDFDPTNDTIVAQGHITVALGRDYDDVSPLKGVTVGGGAHTVHVSVRVEPAPA